MSAFTRLLNTEMAMTVNPMGKHAHRVNQTKTRSLSVSTTRETLIQRFDDGSNTLPNTDTHGSKSVASATTTQLISQRQDQTRP